MQKTLQRAQVHAKKIIAVLLSVMMVMSFCCASAFSAMTSRAYADGETGSITINNAVVGQTYTIYQILDLESYNASVNAYAYKATSAWNSFINSKDIKGTYVAVDDQGYVTWNEGADAAAFAKLAQKYVKDNSSESTSFPNQGTKTAEGATVSFTGLDLGYYLVDTTLGTLCSLDTTDPTATIMEKNAAPTNDKTVLEGNGYGKTNDANIGDTVYFQSTITAQAGAENYVFHDSMSAGLTYIGVTGITLNDTTTVDASNYTITAPATDGDTFDVVFTQAFCDTLKANDKIVISYTATLNENAAIAGSGNTNTSKLSYGDSSNTKYTTESTTTTYTWDVDVFKYTMNGDTAAALANATFTLSKNADGSNPIALVSEGSNVYRVAKTGETVTVTEVTTGATGKFTVKGLDSGTYYLTETKAPAGYNKLAGPVTIVVGADGKTYVDSTVVDEVGVLNQSGTELPSTGGMGTTFFYIIGGLLVAAAGVTLVVRRRSRED